MSEFEVGQKVIKPQGYKFDSTIVAVFETTAGHTRVVAENGDGLLHIFNEKQLEHADDSQQHGGFRWGQHVYVKQTPRTSATHGKQGRISGFRLSDPLIASVDMTGELTTYAYHIDDLGAM